MSKWPTPCVPPNPNAALIHTESNNGCVTARYISTFSAADPGTMVYPASLLQFPPELQAGSLGLTTSSPAFTGLINAIAPPLFFYKIPSCLAACGLPPTAAQSG